MPPSLISIGCCGCNNCLFLTPNILKVVATGFANYSDSDATHYIPGDTIAPCHQCTCLNRTMYFIQAGEFCYPANPIVGNGVVTPANGPCQNRVCRWVLIASDISNAIDFTSPICYGYKWVMDVEKRTDNHYWMSCKLISGNPALGWAVDNNPGTAWNGGFALGYSLTLWESDLGTDLPDCNDLDETLSPSSNASKDPACDISGSSLAVTVVSSVPSNYMVTPFPPCGCNDNLPPATLQVAIANSGTALDGNYTLDLSQIYYGLPNFLSVELGYEQSTADYNYDFPVGSYGAGNSIEVFLATTHAIDLPGNGFTTRYLVGLRGVYFGAETAQWNGSCSGINVTFNTGGGPDGNETVTVTN